MTAILRRSDKIMTTTRSLSRCAARGLLIIAGVWTIGATASCNRNDPGTWSTKTAHAALRSDLAVAPQVSLGANPDVGFEHAELDQAAMDVLLQAADSNSPLLRANAIEALLLSPAHLPPILRRALADENRGVRFVASMTTGRLRLKELQAHLEPLLSDSSESVQAAAIYAAIRCGMKADPTPLAGMLRSESPEVRANAAMVLGELGEPSAIKMLRAAMGRDMKRESAVRLHIVDLQIAEAIVKLGEADELEGIRAALFAPGEQGEIISLACQIAGNLADNRSAAQLFSLATREGERRMPAEVRMTAAAALAKIDAESASLAVPLEYVEHPRFELRAQAASTLGTMGNRAALPHLAKMLSDPNPMVQVSAAGAILRIR